jgi:hypothetical protein
VRKVVLGIRTGEPVNTMGVVRLMKPERTALSTTQSGSPATIPVTAA